jgi:uncharacterized protein (DUF1810 family)
MPTLQRFKNAQERPHDGFAAALAELRAGRKSGHWIWYIFPQLAGLGSSPASEAYSISGVDEAIDYLRDPLLRERLLVVTSAVAERMRAGQSLAAVMSAHVDALKVVSSLTLFEAVARRLQASAPEAGYQPLVDAAETVLAAAEAEGYPRCAFTLRAVASARARDPGRS